MNDPVSKNTRPPRQYQLHGVGEILDKSPTQDPAELLIHQIYYPDTTFETAMLSFQAVVDALYDVEPSFTALPPHENHLHATYREGRGFGLFADRDFAPGDTIILERPSIIVPVLAICKIHLYLPLVVDRLPDMQKLLFTLLSSCHPDRPFELGIITTNQFGFKLPVPHLPAIDSAAWRPKDSPMDTDVTSTHGMLFLTAARLNHS
jgi:hypothetical protein